MPSDKIDYNAASEALRRELKKIAGEMREAAIVILKKKRATGDLIDSMIAEVDTVIDGFIASIGPTASYGLYVERGARARSVPIDALKHWADHKWPGRFYGSEMDQFAYLVWRKILRDGTKAAPYMDPVFRRFAPQIPQRLANAAMRKI